MRNFWTLCVVFLGLLALAACGGGGEEAPAAADPAPAAAGGSAAKTVDPASTGSISGAINYTGEQPKLARLRMGADPTCDKQHSDAVYSQDLLLNDDGTVMNAFVWVKSGLDGYSFDAPSDAVVLDQKGCIYTPHVVGLQTGQTMEILNSDDTTHNINPSPQNNRNWNESQGPGGEAKIKTFAREEVMIPVKCNVHPWMKAYIGVVSHPFFAVTGDDGSFSLDGLPAGEYTVEVWHEKLGTQEKKVTVTAKQDSKADFSFSG